MRKQAADIRKYLQHAEGNIMYIHNRLLSLIYRFIFLIVCGIGLYLNSGIATGELAAYMLVFYTIQSNILCFIFFSILFFKNISDLKNKGIRGTTLIFPRFKGAVTMSIAVTFLTYHFVLVPQYISTCSNYNLLSWQNLIVHYFVPLAAIFDWLLFDKKSSFRWYDPILWVLIPITYFISIIIRAQLGKVIDIVKSQYPYFFIDVDMLGWICVLKNVSLLILAFLFVGYAIYIIDKISFERIAVRMVDKKQKKQLLNIINTAAANPHHQV